MKIRRVVAVLTLATLTSLVAVGCEGGGGPLMVAARQDDLTNVRALIKSGVSVDTRGFRGVTPLHAAAKHGHVDVIRALIFEGHARVDSRDDDGETPLDLACKYGQVEAAKVLIAAGADVNLKDDQLWTPLHFAARNGSVEIVKMLLAKKADVNALAHEDDEADADDKPELTPMELARDNRHYEVADLLRDAGAVR